jgi:predicted transcriptional regulator
MQQISGHVSDELYSRLVLYVAKRKAQDKKTRQEKVLEQALQEFLDREESVQNST